MTTEKPKETKVFQVTFPLSLVEWCDQQAENKDISRSYFVRMCVEHCLETDFSRNLPQNVDLTRFELKLEQILNEVRKGEHEA